MKSTELFLNPFVYVCYEKENLKQYVMEKQEPNSVHVQLKCNGTPLGLRIRKLI
jgi:hypothetical protein